MSPRKALRKQQRKNRSPRPNPKIREWQPALITVMGVVIGAAIGYGGATAAATRTAEATWESARLQVEAATAKERRERIENSYTAYFSALTDYTDDFKTWMCRHHLDPQSTESREASIQLELSEAVWEEARGDASLYASSELASADQKIRFPLLAIAVGAAGGVIIDPGAPPTQDTSNEAFFGCIQSVSEPIEGDINEIQRIIQEDLGLIDQVQ